MKKLLTLLTLLLALSTPARAQDAFVPPLPRDFDKVDVYLLTVGRGDAIYAIYGHTILRVVDRSTNMDLNFNWGIFDYEDPAFAWKFYLGDLNYMMIITDYWSLIDHYRSFEHRSVTQDRIVLTAKQKEALFRRLIENSRPENVHYWYSQFKDNCATKPRDHLDAALGGKISALYGKRRARVSLRHHIRWGADAIWWVYLGLDSLSNSMLDRPVSNWDEMFLPINLRKHLLEMPAFDDNGMPIPGRNLLEDHVRVVDLPEPGVGANPYMMVALLLGIPMAAGALFMAGRCNRWGERHAAVTLGLMSLAFGLWSAVWGTVATANWAISHYAELKHNAALWLFWPIDWLFLVYGLRLLVKRSRPATPSRLARAVTFVASAHLTGLLALTVLWLTGVVKQDVLGTLASSGLIGVLYYGTTIRHASAREP